MKKKDFIKQWILLKHEEMMAHRSSKRLLQRIKILLLGGIVIAIIGMVVLIAVVLPTLPDIDNIQNLVASQSSTIHDREGNLLYIIHGDENREVIPLSQVPQHAIDAILAIEDDEFYKHRGVDFTAILKAVCGELRICSKARGGSTITQQFIKNAFLSSERTYSRKLKEIILALQLEGRFEKDEILEMYFNRIPYGSNIYGIERAANIFFGKKATELTVAEGAVLAAIPKAPTYYSPYGNNKTVTINLDGEELIQMDILTEQDLVDINIDFIDKGLLGRTFYYTEDGQEVFPEVIMPDVEVEPDDTEVELPKVIVNLPDSETFERSLYVKGRTDLVLVRMLSLGFIDEEIFEEAIFEAEHKQFKTFREEIKAPHFVFYVRQYLEEKYGKEQVEQGGLRVITTIDPKLQEAAEEAIASYAELNLERYDASNASLVSMDPNNGQILAMVGSVDYFNDEIDGQVNVALRPRLPGSSFKPIVYAAAYLQGYAPSTILYDVRTKFGSWYEPENYDGEYRGPVTMRQALAHSLNVPAVKAGYLAGIPNVVDLARRMGIQLNQPDDWYGLSLALGAGEARLLDMVTAYSIFSNGGYRMDPVSILKIEDRNGNILEEYDGPVNKTQILDPQVAYLINTVLSDVEARPAGWWRDQLSLPGQTNGAKTGTSNKEIRNVNYPFDTWTLGYTRKIATGVWAGNNDGKHLNFKASGLDTAGRIWHDYMVVATKDMPRESFDRPEGIKYIRVSEKTGKLPSEYTPAEVIKTEIFASFSVPREYDTAYRLVEVDKVSGLLATEYTPEAAVEEKAFFEHHAIVPDNLNWEEPVRRWAKENGEDEPVPTEYDNVHTSETLDIRPEITIKSPSNLASVSAPYVGVWPRVESPAGINYVEFYWDGELKDTVTSSPFKGTIEIVKRGNKKGSTHTIKAIVYDGLYRSSQSSIQVKIGDDDIQPLVDFAYPGDGVRLDAGSSMVTQVDAFDPNGDIEKLLFYMDGELVKTLHSPPYLWQFVVPRELGQHTLQAVAYDYAGNKGSEKIDIISREPEDVITGSSSRILQPYKNASFDQGARVLIKAYLNEEAQDGLKELIVTARQKGKKTIEVAKVLGDEKTGGAYTYTFIWASAPAGTYDLAMKIILQNGKIRFSERVPIVVR